jgi:squalene-hopene/tetraprenyl-beta-curcumene cyclase
MSTDRIDPSRLQAALAKARQALLDARTPAGHWEGELSASALSTATAVCALALLEKFRVSNSEFRDASGDTPRSAPDTRHSAIAHGLAWLAAHVNPDGGWGDTTLSLSNISTTALVWAAFGVVPGADEKYRAVVTGAKKWLTQRAGGITPDQLADVIIARYGKDRTFSVPILTMCALSGRFGTGRDAWRRVLPLPFELAVFPQKLFAALRLPVVSYALPALIAIGQVRHHHWPTRNPLTRLARNLARAKTLRVLTNIQPTSGGFLEATPLTSFVVMSLAGSGNANHSVVIKGVEFLLKSVRPDGSWPIDTNLATWVTTLAVNALGPSIHKVMSAEERQRILDWLLDQQYRTVHPYTNAPPGGWAWTDLPGGVPDADDTAGALLALTLLGSSRGNEAPSECGVRSAECRMGSPSLLTSAATSRIDPRVREAAIAGVTWLLNLQNRDGGIPTFCRGWTNLPFDRSGSDLTAHALRAWLAWLPRVPTTMQTPVVNALRHLRVNQRADGSWIPLWFGNQHSLNEDNPTYGTARVLQALAGLDEGEHPDVCGPKKRAVQWLLTAQNPDGGWGGSSGVASSVEETALAVEALAGVDPSDGTDAPLALARGIEWLIHRVEDGTWTQPSPVGFYFAKLWYYERLYPQIFTVAALEQASRGLK